ncbi:HNH endonuclease [Lentilactobacillus buchneri]|nr:HNH endonuclease [Lentilactobacillus buchneri]
MYSINVRAWMKLRKQVFQRDDYTCRYCGKRGGLLEADHVIPFSKGGSDDISNLVTACRRCNRQKRDKSVAEFEDWLKEGRGNSGTTN